MRYPFQIEHKGDKIFTESSEVCSITAAVVVEYG